jgi:hypothetical protein
LAVGFALLPTLELLRDGALSGRGLAFLAVSIVAAGFAAIRRSRM